MRLGEIYSIFENRQNGVLIQHFCFRFELALGSADWLVYKGCDWFLANERKGEVAYTVPRERARRPFDNYTSVTKPHLAIQ